MTTTVTANHLVELLGNLEERGKKEAKGLPSRQESEHYWEGFVFSVVNQQLLASMEEITEILNQVPPITRVPGSKIWVRGVVNFRGTLLPVMDLQQLLGGRALVLGRHSRILVIDQDGVKTGLLVASVAGRKRFLRTGFRQLKELDPSIKPFVEGGFIADVTEWPVFNVGMLMAYPDYQSAAR